METTWRLRPNALWHDGVRVTAADVAFSAMFAADRDLAIRRSVAYDLMDAIETPDYATVVVKWKTAFIQADTVFKPSLIPRHLLEAAYAQDKSSFLQLPYWAEDYIGAGPFKLREWERGSHARLVAHDGYALGRPRIDEVEVRFIPDPNTLMASILAGAVDVTLGKNLSTEEAVQVRDQWRDGRLEVVPGNWIILHPQLLNPDPAVVTDVQFRRALLHGTNRQELVDTLGAGLSSVAHSYVNPIEAAYPESEPRIVRYAYDPALATRLIEGLGYTKGPDGIFRDSLGQRLAVSIRHTATDLVNVKTTLSVVDAWQRLGLVAEPAPVPQQRLTDAEYLATHPSFRLLAAVNTIEGLSRLYSSQAPLPENNFRGNNYSRYMNPAFDALLDRFFTTIPARERTRLLGDIAQHISEQLNLMGLFYDTNGTLISGRLLHVNARHANSTQAWNAQEWDLR
jgi:peptide/nickel transport system substrate-binding protein